MKRKIIAKHLKRKYRFHLGEFSNKSFVLFGAERVNYQGPVVRRWVKFNPGLGETLNIIPSSRNTSGLSKLLLKNTPRKPKYVNPKWQPKSIFKEVNQIAS